MVMSLKQHKAAEKKYLDDCLREYPSVYQDAERFLNKISSFIEPTGKKILEIGSAQGLFVIACKSMGYDVEGLEPDEDAIRTSIEMSEAMGSPAVTIHQGFAEEIPCKDQSFDIVWAFSVMEHVRDLEKVIGEIARILRPGGMFFFSTASSLCPMQQEIRFFPCFSWYPTRIKRKIMAWVSQKAPSLIGHTDAPAINWFTPWGTMDLLNRHGFTKVFDQWDMRVPSNFTGTKRILLSFIRMNRATKLLADICYPGCSYLTVK